MNILLVDDDAVIREMLAMALTEAGHNVVMAENGKIAIQKIHAERFDLIITDIIMPEKEGIETIMAARKLLPDLRIIAISGRGSVYNLDPLEIASQIGAHATLEKPFAPETLLKKIKEITGG